MRNFLFIPGNNPKMLSSADFLGSDSILIDLEDAVAPSEKDAARILTRNAIKALCYSKTVGVRINSTGTEHWQRDLSEMLPLGIDYIVLPKVECAEDILSVDRFISEYYSLHECKKEIWIMALLETALGTENAFSIAKASPRIKALFLGAEDLTGDLCAKRTAEGKEILYARSRIVCAARAAGIEVFDTPFTDINDEKALESDANLARQLGFSGKAAIHPCQIEVINSIFSPTEEEIAYAGEVLAIYEEAVKNGLGAVALHGKMIDAPILERAKRVLAQAKEIESYE